VQVSHSEGLANHTGPEPCVDIREDAGEASVGERIGQPLSREKSSIRRPTRLITRKAIGQCNTASINPSGVVEDPGMCGSSLHGNREVSGSTCEWTPQVRIGKTRSRSR
jgi:hypothetical protein